MTHVFVLQQETVIAASNLEDVTSYREMLLYSAVSKEISINLPSKLLNLSYNPEVIFYGTDKFIFAPRIEDF